jgi:hypothetical protein
MSLTAGSQVPGGARILNLGGPVEFSAYTHRVDLFKSSLVRRPVDLAFLFLRSPLFYRLGSL